MRAAENVVVARTGILSWRRLCALYALLLAISLGYIAQSGGPEWLAGGELLWVAIDIGLLTAMVRGSITALAVCGALDVSALGALIVAEAGQPQAGFTVMVCLLVARLFVLLQAWRQRV
jgi:hypothetical protein